MHIHKDYHIQCLAPHRTTQTLSESGVPMLLELWQLKAVPTAIGCLLHAHRTISWPPLDLLTLQPHAGLSGPVSVSREQSSALPPCSLWGAIGHHEASPLLGWINQGDLSLSSCTLPSRPYSIFIALPWLPSNSVTSLHCGTQNCTQCSRFCLWKACCFIDVVLNY